MEYGVTIETETLRTTQNWKVGITNMGTVYVNVNLSNPARPGLASEDVRVLVDTGATLSVFPATLLDRLGIKRIG